MKKYVIGVMIISWLLVAGEARADVLNPEFDTKKCPAGEKEIICNYTSKLPFGPTGTEDECGRYASDPRYYFLVGTGSSLGGLEKYCLRAGEKENILVEWRQIIKRWMRQVLGKLGWVYL